MAPRWWWPFGVGSASRTAYDELGGYTLSSGSVLGLVRDCVKQCFDCPGAQVCTGAGGVICQQGVFFRADLFASTKGFNPENSIAWDAELFHDLLLKARHPLYVEDFLGAFRVYGDSITGSNSIACCIAIDR